MASKGLNRCEFMGNLGKDAEGRDVGNGRVVSYSLGCTRSFKQNDQWKDETTWVDIVQWNPGKLEEYLVKGQRLWVSGRLQNRSWEDKDGNKRYKTEIVAEEVILCGSSNGGGERRQSRDEGWDPPPPRSTRGPQPVSSAPSDDDVPW